MNALPALAAALGFALATPAAAEDGTSLQLKVGETMTVGGSGGMCDDLSVATIALGPPAAITGLKPGATTCAARVNGIRRVYQVRVLATPPAPAPGSRDGQPPGR
jgi:hypothetical protein